MGDMLLKQKPPRMPPWQNQEMMRRPWPPMYRTQQRQSFNFRPPEPRDWREFGFPNAAYSNGSLYQPNKGRDYYFLAPYYRNAMPPPPNPHRDRLLMVDPTRRRVNNGNARGNGVVHGAKEVPCQCRSKSMEDVRTEVVEVASEWDEDENGNRVRGKDRKAFYGRRSMENLLVDTTFPPTSKRIGSFQV